MRKKKMSVSILWMVLFTQLYGQTLTKISDVTFGGQNNDAALFVFKENSGSFYTFGNIAQSPVPVDITVQYGRIDYSVVKYDRNGNKIWDNVYGGSADDVLYKVIPISSGFLLAGIPY